MSILGERFFKLSNALFCYHLTPIQFTVYSFLVSSAGQKGNCWPSKPSRQTAGALKTRHGRPSVYWNSGDSSGGSSDTRIAPTEVCGRPAMCILFWSHLRSPPPGGTPPQEREGKYMNKTKGNKENPPPQGQCRHKGVSSY